MAKTRLTLHPRSTIAPVSPLVFGGFLEHMGRCVYEGVYDPTSSHADPDGIRTDVLDALKGLEMSVVRYPGGNFASGYHWRDGVGPADERPTVRELAWQSLEPNRFGTDEFLSLCRKADWQPMLCANLGTGTPEEARDWVEYCNGEPGSRWADLRVANGQETPHRVPYWCLGNEMDGPWQLGHVPADHYAIRAQQAGKMIKDCDRSVKLVACGSSGPDMPGFLEWDRTVLERLGGLADYVSLHRYVGNESDDPNDYLAIGNSIDAQIEAVDACCRYVAAKRKRPKRAMLCFDEWNVWYKARSAEDVNGRGQFAPHLIEEVYNLEDALVVASFLMSFIRHADVVKIANIAQIVNVIAPLLTRGDDLLVQSIYYAFQMISQRKSGTSLRLLQEGPIHTSSSYGECPELDCAAILNPDSKQLHVFAMNRNVNQSAELEISLAGAALAPQRAEILHADSLKTANGFDAPGQVVSRAYDEWQGGELATAELPPHSFLATTFSLTG
jgi:alpha-N-arabinofuranosidase